MTPKVRSPGASRKDNDVEVVTRLLAGDTQGRFVVGYHTQELDLSSVVAHGGRHRGGVGVVDLAGLERSAGADQLVTGRDDGDTGPLRDADAFDAQCGKHAELASGEFLPGA
jgi:hypothetical protein